ncbi:MAG TPA: hypothetical protein VFV38_23165 [Ktedonobacteraceae bacterium]|nr:hypothetical protein [Ktedonobacteraceae bacterium]
MNPLIQRLSTGTQPVTVSNSHHSVADLKQRIEEVKYVFVKFTETQGGTNLGIKIDEDATDLSRADFDKATGIAHIEGTLTLDYVKVRCIANIDLATMNGTGHLVILEEVKSL